MKLRRNHIFETFDEANSENIRKHTSHDRFSIGNVGFRRRCPDCMQGTDHQILNGITNLTSKKWLFEKQTITLKELYDLSGERLCNAHRSRNGKSVGCKIQVEGKTQKP
jgi:hypothetical protein